MNASDKSSFRVSMRMKFHPEGQWQVKLAPGWKVVARRRTLAECAVAILLLALPLSGTAAVCTGKEDCKACVNCRFCRHCNPPRSPKDTRPKPGCGVCKPKPKAPPPITVS